MPEHNKSKPVDVFIKYFNNNKPYHVKVLELLETYKFQDNLDVFIREKIKFAIKQGNNPLCRSVGYGIDFDGDCGFDALNCCDLFECVGDYGLVFDNSELLVTESIVEVDSTSDAIVVAGNHTFDRKFNISSIPSNDTIIVNGDITSYLDIHSIFNINPVNVFNVVETGSNYFIISGNHAELFENKIDFIVYDDGNNDGRYNVQEAGYSLVDNQTKILVSDTLDASSTGTIEISAGTLNNGFYQVQSYNYNGSETTITLSSNHLIDFDNSTTSNHGAVAFRTGLLPYREIVIENSDAGTNGEYTILQSFYDINTDTTTVITIESIQEDSIIGDLNLYGYATNAGFDSKNCSSPKDYHLYSFFHEQLDINVTTILPSPTPTPTVTPTPSPVPPQLDLNSTTFVNSYSFPAGGGRDLAFNNPKLYSSKSSFGDEDLIRQYTLGEPVNLTTYDTIEWDSDPDAGYAVKGMTVNNGDLYFIQDDNITGFSGKLIIFQYTLNTSDISLSVDTTQEVYLADIISSYYGQSGQDFLTINGHNHIQFVGSKVYISGRRYFNSSTAWEEGIFEFDIIGGDISTLSHNGNKIITRTSTGSIDTDLKSQFNILATGEMLLYFEDVGDSNNIYIQKWNYNSSDIGQSTYTGNSFALGNNIKFSFYDALVVNDRLFINDTSLYEYSLVYV